MEPNSKLELTGEVRPGVLAALAAVLAHARLQLEHVAVDPEVSVHSFRKSVRRARSLVRFAQPWIGKPSRKAIEGRLKTAFAPTSALRDGDVLAGVLAAFVERHPQFADVGVGARATGDAAGVLQRSVTDLAGIEAAFEEVLPVELGDGDLRAALDVRIAATQRSRAGARLDDLEAVHDWRKRTKELRYSLELLSGRLTSEGRAAHAAMEALAKELGELADLLALGAWARGQGLADLVAVSEDEVREGRDRALAGTESLFVSSESWL